MADAFDRAHEAVVHVFVQVRGQNDFKYERPSSGIIVSPEGLVVTWWSLVAEAFEAQDDGPSKAAFVKLANGDQHPVSVAARSARSGLVLLKIETAGQSFHALPIRRDRAAAGEVAGVYGFQDGEEHAGFTGVVSLPQGPVRLGTESNKVLAPDSFLLTSAAIQQRSHGAALIDGNGSLIGICNATHVRVIGKRDPTAEDFRIPSYGFVFPSDEIAQTFARYLSGTRKAVPPPPSPGVSAYEAAALSVVTVRAGNRTDEIGDSDPFAWRRRAGVGSGVILNSDGLVITNRHLVAAGGPIRVRTASGKTFNAELVNSKLRANLALLQLQGAHGLTAIQCAPADSVAVGQALFAIGRPEKTGASIHSGIASAIRSSELQVDAHIGNANGGGAIVDADGRLVGIADAGIIDRIERALQRNGSRAKVDDSLSVVPGVGILHRTLADQIPAPQSAAPSAQTTSEKDLARIVESIAPAMLNVYIEAVIREDTSDNPFAQATERRVVTSLGSGVVIDPSGLALTNWHVVDAATFPDGSANDSFAVKVVQFGGETHEADVLSISREDDLALIRLRLDDGDAPLHAIEFGDSDSLSIGDRAFAIGNPHGRANTVTAGVVCALDQGIRVRGRFRKLEPLIETDAAINGGNSGGALLDGAGRLIGINSAGGSGLNITGYAIPVNHVRKRLREALLTPHKMRTVYTGLICEDRGGEVIVSEVVEYSPAERAGIQIGDRITSFDGKEMRWTVDQVVATVGRGIDPIGVEFERDGQPGSVNIAPISPQGRLVERMIGVQIETVSFRNEIELIRGAAVARERFAFGNDTAQPNEIPRSLVRVARRSIPENETRLDSALEVGDLLVAMVFRSDTGEDTQRQTLYLDSATTIIETLRGLLTLTKSGQVREQATVDFWVFRDNKIITVPVIAKRVPW